MKMRPIVGIATVWCLLAFAACGKTEAGAPDGATPKAVAPPPVSASAVASASAPPTIPAPPDVGAPPADAVKTPSGLASKVLTPGTGHDHPGPTDRVKVHYTGWTKGGA